MKKSFLNLLTLSTLLLLIASCSNNNSLMLKMIPHDAIAVVEINPSTIAQHLELGMNNGNIQLPKEVESILTPETSKKVNENFQSLTKLNIDLKSNIYLMANLDDATSAITMLVPIKDDKECQQGLSELGKKNQHPIAFTEKEGMQVAIANPQTGIAIHDGIMIAYMPMNGSIDEKKLVDYAKKLYQHDYKSIAEVDKAKEQLSSDHDINLYLNVKRLTTLMGSLNAGFYAQIPLMQYTQEVDAMCYSIDLKDRMVTIEGEVIANEDSDYMKMLNSLSDVEPSNSFLDVQPANANMLMVYHLNGENLAKFQQMEGIGKQIKESGVMGDVDLMEFLKSIKGAISVGFIKDNEGDNFEVVVGIESTNVDYLKKAITQIAQTITGTPFTTNDQETIWNFGTNIVSLSSKSKTVILKYCDNIDIAQAQPLSSNQEVQKLFKGAKSAMWGNYNINGQSLHFDATSNDLKTGSMHFYATDQAGKKMSILCYGNLMNQRLNF